MVHPALLSYGTAAPNAAAANGVWFRHRGHHIAPRSCFAGLKRVALDDLSLGFGALSKRP